MKKLWLDVETTGLNSEKNGIIQLACIKEDTKEKFSINIKPFKDCVYTKKAEDIHGKSKKVIANYESETVSLDKFTKFLGKDGQYSIAGYNSRFDQDFIIALFKRHKQYSYWDFFNYYDIDVFALVKILNLNGTLDGKKTKKLEAICSEFGIKLNAHDAIEDIKATRKLYKKIVKKYLK